MQHPLHSSVSLQLRTPAQPLAGSIQFTTGTCSHGALLVARNDDGLCAIFMADAAAALVPQLATAFPGRLLMDASTDMAAALSQVAKFIDEPHADVHLALSVGGTPFQQRVWPALCDVPAGTTTSYAALAQAIGAPDATRAVANACAANLLAVAIPCHRVVRGDGAVSNYRWGQERKRRLLAHEMPR